MITQVNVRNNEFSLIISKSIKNIFSGYKCSKDMIGLCLSVDKFNSSLTEIVSVVLEDLSMLTGMYTECICCSIHPCKL